MKKQLLYWGALMISALLFFPSGAYATLVPVMSESFSSTPATNWGFGTVTGQTFTYEPTNKLLQVRWSASSYTTKSLTTAIPAGTDNKITVDAIVNFYTSGNSANGGTLYFLDSNGNAIFGITMLRLSSQWRIARATDYPGLAVQTVLPARTDILATSTSTTIAKITAVLDMSAKTLSYTATVGTFDYGTRIFTPGTITVSSTSQAFINAAAADIKTLQSNYFRPSSVTGTSGYDLMYMAISTEQTVETADVTVQYKDQDNNLFKSYETVSAQPVGSTYSATSIQKASLNSGGNYYVLDTSSPTSVVVATGGSTLSLLFRRATVYSTMLWNGTTGTNTDAWSEWYQNFLNGSTATSYQKDASVTFDATAVNKAVQVNESVNLGAGNVTVSADGYSFSGLGSMSGTGSLNINLSGISTLSLGVTNNMTGSTQIAGGSITATKAGTLGSSIVISGPTTLTSNYPIPTTTFNASSLIQSTAATSISNMTVPSGTKVSISSSFNTANSAYAFSFGTTGTFAGELELNGTGTDTKFGMSAVASDYLANAKVTLKGTAYLFVDAGQSAATTMNIGTLNGESGARLGWGKTATAANDITWSVGGLNENSTYAGTITNIGGYQGSGVFYTGTKTNFTKVGTGVLIFSGTANTHNGNFVVKGGELSVTGAIGNAASKDTVALGATLSGTGTIGGATIVNGTLQGRLNFGSSLILAGTTNLTVNGFGTTQYDSISVVGAVTLGGILNVTVNASAPAFGTFIRIIKASSYTGSFATVNAPTGYMFDASSGNLVYGFYTNIDQKSNGKLSIYPTLTHDFVNIVGANSSTIELVNLIGQTVRNISSTSEKTILNMNGLTTGTYFVKVRSIDGSVKVQKVLYQK